MMVVNRERILWKVTALGLGFGTVMFAIGGIPTAVMPTPGSPA